MISFTAPRPLSIALSCLAGAVVFVTSGQALARSGGIATEGCTGCHRGGKTPTVTITPDVTTVTPGSVVNLTISISPTNGTGAGMYLEASTGKFTITDSGTHLLGDGVAHSATRTAASGNIVFKAAWTAPSIPGGVDFSVWGNSVNNDRGTGGDAEGFAFYSVAFGCTGSKFYHDYDGDGFGVESSGYTSSCAAPPFYAAKAGDCNDNDPKIFPGNAEICDSKDNNCDGQVDEGLPISTYCTDADSDGHGVLGKTTVMGCGPSKGFGVCDNDCNDADPAMHAGAVEVCNNKDDNCNDRVDENARVVCGVGWCAKYAEGCTSNCTPGEPRAEECNDFDDDCDGVKDNGTDLQLCGMPGLHCQDGNCVAGAGGAGSSGTGGTQSASGGASGPAASGAAATPNAGREAPEATAPPSCAFGVSSLATTHFPGALLGLLFGLVRRTRRRQTQKFGPRLRIRER